MSKMPNRTSLEKGQSLMELAISVTFLLILVSGLVDLGRVIFYYLSLRDAAEEGMVYGVVYPTYCTQIENAIRGNVENDPNIQITVTEDGVSCTGAGSTHACAEKPLVITVVNPSFPLTMPFIGGFIGSQTISLRATIQGTIIRPDCHP